MICAVCNATLPDESRFCLSCGVDMSDPSAERRPFDTVAEVQKVLTGAVAGHYRVGRLLGRGGMGTVFLAEDLTLQREVALKVLPPRLTAEEKFVSRFLHEARTAAKLDHPNIIPIYAVESNEELHYFAMKYVAGKTVDQLLEAGPLPVDECRRILGDAAMALAHAHQRGVVHRDVKPSNIMLDESGRVMLTDFGISKALESSTQFTGTGQIVGTPHYMSPEQAKGGIKLDGRSDQYALAVVGFQMLTGRLLFPATQAHTIIYGHIHEPPPSPRALRPEIPEYLERALLKALAKNPEQRFATTEDFGAAVYPELLSAVSGGASRSRPTFGNPFATRSRAGILGVAAAAVAIAGGAYFVFHRATPAAPAPATAPVTAPALPAASPVAAPPADRGATAPAQQQRERPVTAPQPPAPRTTAAETAAGFLTVDAQPYGTLSIDGVDVGDTPTIRHALAPGTYTVRVVRDGYRAWSARITITSGNTERRRVVLEAVP